MRVFHLIALIFGALAWICALLSVTGTKKGWLENGPASCGTLECCASGNCAKIKDIFVLDSDCDLETGGKVTLALVVINLVVTTIACVIVLLRLLGVLKSRGLSILAAVFFVIDFILSIVAIGVYTGFYVGGCCNSNCSADGGYALILCGIGILFSLVTFILLFIRPVYSSSLG